MAPDDKMTRVLMTADAVGGVWTYATELCRNLASRGIEVTLAVLGPPPSADQRAEIAALPQVSLHCRPCKLEWMADPWDDVAGAGEWLLGLESKVAPDVVHLNGYCHGACRWQAPSVVVGHSCVLSWWQAVRGEPAPPEWAPYGDAVRRGLQSADVVVAPSAGMLTELERFYGPLPRARVIVNGRSRTDITQRKEPLVLTAGRLWDAATNIAAVSAVAGTIAWPIAVAGATAEDQSGESSAAGLDRIRYLGRLSGDEVRRWMGRASIYVMPACYEPFGLSVLEAALAGCALVLGDIPTLREIWGDAAIYVDPHERDALRRALNALIDDSGRRQTLATAAFRRAATLTPQRMTDEYCALYQELIRERRAVLSLSAV